MVEAHRVQAPRLEVVGSRFCKTLATLQARRSEDRGFSALEQSWQRQHLPCTFQSSCFGGMGAEPRHGSLSTILINMLGHRSSRSCLWNKLRPSQNLQTHEILEPIPQPSRSHVPHVPGNSRSRSGRFYQYSRVCSAKIPIVIQRSYQRDRIVLGAPSCY
jgi:hypothetical protein